MLKFKLKTWNFITRFVTFVSVYKLYVNVDKIWKLIIALNITIVIMYIEVALGILLEIIESIEIYKMYRKYYRLIKFPNWECKCI